MSPPPAARWRSRQFTETLRIAVREPLVERRVRVVEPLGRLVDPLELLEGTRLPPAAGSPRRPRRSARRGRGRAARKAAGGANSRCSSSSASIACLCRSMLPLLAGILGARLVPRHSVRPPYPTRRRYPSPHLAPGVLYAGAAVLGSRSLVGRAPPASPPARRAADSARRSRSRSSCPAPRRREAPRRPGSYAYRDVVSVAATRYTTAALTASARQATATSRASASWARSRCLPRRPPSRDGADGRSAPATALRRRDRIRRERRRGRRRARLARSTFPGIGYVTVDQRVVVSPRTRAYRAFEVALAPPSRRRLARPPRRHRGPRSATPTRAPATDCCTRSRRQGRAARTAARARAAAVRAASPACSPRPPRRCRPTRGADRTRATVPPPGSDATPPGRLTLDPPIDAATQAALPRPELPLPAGRWRALPERLRHAARGHALQPGHRPLRARRHAGARSPDGTLRRSAGATSAAGRRGSRTATATSSTTGTSRPTRRRQERRAGPRRRRDRLPRRLGRRRRATPFHLHFEIHPAGKWAVPPYEYVQAWLATEPVRRDPAAPAAATRSRSSQLASIDISRRLRASTPRPSPAVAERRAASTAGAAWRSACLAPTASELARRAAPAPIDAADRTRVLERGARARVPLTQALTPRSPSSPSAGTRSRRCRGAARARSTRRARCARCVEEAEQRADDGTIKLRLRTARRLPARGRRDAPRRPPHGLPLLAVRLRARVHVLRDRAAWGSGATSTPGEIVEQLAACWPAGCATSTARASRTS